jgi:hypothetical protein
MSTNKTSETYAEVSMVRKTGIPGVVVDFDEAVEPMQVHFSALAAGEARATVGERVTGFSRTRRSDEIPFNTVLEAQP